MNISGVTDLYAWEFDFAFNPAVVGAVSVSEGPFLSGAGGTFFVPGTINNVLGTIIFTSNTLIGASPGATGSGTLATVRFSGLAPGTSVLSLSNVILLDSGLSDISATSTAATLDVTDGPTVPEPGSLLLVFAGLGAAGAGRRLRRSEGR